MCQRYLVSVCPLPRPTKLCYNIIMNRPTCILVPIEHMNLMNTLFRLPLRCRPVAAKPLTLAPWDTCTFWYAVLLLLAAQREDEQFNNNIQLNGID